MFDDQPKNQQFNLAFSCQSHSIQLNTLKDTQGVTPDHRNFHGIKKFQNNTTWIRKPRRKKDEVGNKNRKKGHWSLQQNKKYHEFLQIYNKHFLNKQMRRTQKIFKRMQAFLGSREAQQCRSHHQKMQKKHKNFQSILLHLRYLFYRTQDHLLVKQDLANKSINFYDDLLQGQMLRKNNQLQYKNSNYLDKQQQKGQPSQEKQQEQEKSQNIISLEEQSKDIENILSDKYENHMDFNNLLT